MATMNPLVRRCRSLWNDYYRNPSQAKLRGVLKHLGKMEKSSAGAVQEECRQCKDAASAEATRLGMRRVANPDKQHDPRLEPEDLERLRRRGIAYDPYESWLWADLRNQEYAIEKFVRERGEIPKRIRCNIRIPDIDWKLVDELGGLSAWEREPMPRPGEEGRESPACIIVFEDGYEIAIFRYEDGTWGGGLWDDSAGIIQWIDPRRGAAKAKTDFGTWEQLVEHFLKVVYRKGAVPVRLVQTGKGTTRWKTSRPKGHGVAFREAMEAAAERSASRREMAAELAVEMQEEGLLDEPEGNPRRRNPGYWKQTVLDLLHSLDVEVDEVEEYGTPDEPLVSIELEGDRKFDVWMIPDGKWRWAGDGKTGDISETITAAVQDALSS